MNFFVEDFDELNIMRPKAHNCLNFKFCKPIYYKILIYKMCVLPLQCIIVHFCFSLVSNLGQQLRKRSIGSKIHTLGCAQNIIWWNSITKASFVNVTFSDFNMCPLMFTFWANMFIPYALEAPKFEHYVRYSEKSIFYLFNVHDVRKDKIFESANGKLKIVVWKLFMIDFKLLT